MKKKLVALAFVAVFSVASVATAQMGGGQGGGWGYGDCPMQGQMMQGQKMQQLDPDTRAKIAKFFKDNQALHKQLVMKRAEERALMASSNPDPQAVAKVAGELFDLQTAMHDKAEAAGVAQYLPMRGMGMGGGMMGHRMKGMKGGQGGMMGGQGKPGGNPGQGPTGAAPQQQ